MTEFYQNDNPIKANHIAAMRYDKRGYVRNKLKWFWEDPNSDNKNNTSMNPTPGFVVEFPWSTDLSESEISSYIKDQKDRVLNGFLSPTKDGPDMFPTSKEYMVYKMFCDLVGSRGRILITNENKSSIFFESTEDEKAVDATKVSNLLLRLELFSTTVVEGIANLKNLLETNQVDAYEKEIVNFKNKVETYYNEEILKYAIMNINFYSWNLFDFIVPKEPVGTWIPEDPDDIKALRESRDKVFGEFSHDENLKKIYFDLYDLCLNGIVDHNWRYAVGEGWKDLVKSVFIRFRDREEESFFWWKRIYAAQIKEKFGLLRIYFDFPSDWYFDNVVNGKEDELSNEDVEDYIHELEDYSGHICEMCGKHDDEDPTVETRPSFASNWIKTLCQTCRNEKFMKKLINNVNIRNFSK